MDWTVAEQEHEDIGDVPDDGEAEGDEFPGEEPEVAVIRIVIVVEVEVVIVVVVDVVWGDDSVGQRIANETDANEGENDGEGAQNVFPEELGVIGVHFLTRRTDGEQHDWRIEK